MTLPSVLEGGPEIFISWDGTAAFDGEFDDVSEDVDGTPGLVISEGRDGAQQLSPPKVNDGSCELINDDGTYSQERPDSPVYQRVEPNKPVYFQARHGARRLYRSHTLYRAHVPYRGIAVYPLGRHMIDELDERTAIGSYRVRVDTIGYETVLTRAPVTVAVMTNPLVSECFEALLDAVAWPADKRRIATSDTRLLYWWCDERMPWPAMLELLAAEGPGTFGVDGDGVFYFENRNFRATETRATTSQATFVDTDTGGLTFTVLKPLSPFKNIFNRATYSTRRRSLASLAAIWEYGGTLTLSANQSITFIIRPSDGNPFQNAVTPVAATDYTVTSGSLASVSLSATSGLTAFLTLVAGASGAVVEGVTSTGIQLRAQSLTVLGETVVQNSVDASASIARYSPIPGADIPLTLAINGWPEIDVPNAEAVCDAWVLRQQAPRPQIRFSVRNADAAHLEQILRRQVSDRVTLTHAQSGLDADVWINELTRAFSGFQGRVAELVVAAERCDVLSGAVWDDALWNDAAAVWGV